MWSSPSNPERSPERWFEARLTARLREGVAHVGISGVQPPPEPEDPLLRRPMGEGIGGDAASGLPLDPVVSDRPGGPESLLHIPRLQKPLSCCAVPPYPGQAVGLQLQPDRQAVGLDLARAALETVHLVRGAEELLDVGVGRGGEKGRISRGVLPAEPRRRSLRSRDRRALQAADRVL